MKRLILIFISLSGLVIQPVFSNRAVAETNFACALSLIEQLKEPRDKVDALVHLAKLRLQAGNRTEADKLLFEALNATALIDDSLFKAGAIGEIAEVGTVEHVERAAELAKAVGGSDGVWASRQLITAYGRLGLKDKAAELLSATVERVRSPATKGESWYGDREYELTLLLAVAARAGFAEQALKVIPVVKNKFIKGEVLHAAALALAKEKQERRAIGLARTIFYEIERIDALVDVAGAAADNGNRAAASQALAFALAETRKDIFDPEQDTKAKALVSIALVYEKNKQRAEALRILQRAEKVARTIGKPGFKDAALAQAALAYAKLGDFTKALQVTQGMLSQWSNFKSDTLASIAISLFDAGAREKALSVLAQAAQIAREYDCTYYKYDISVRSCYGEKATFFFNLAAAYEHGGFFGQEREMLDLAALQNKYKKEPPQEIIPDGSNWLADAPVKEQEIIAAYASLGYLKQAGELASQIKRARDKAIAVATIELKAGDSVAGKDFLSRFGCR